jgi:transketolase
VINIHTIKPLDEEAILKSLKTKCIVTAEEHNILEVLESISRVLALNNSSRVCCC